MLWLISQEPRNNRHTLSAKTQIGLCILQPTDFSIGGLYIVRDRRLLIELDHEKMCLMSYANNKGADQPAHPRSLISAFVVRCLDSIISLDSIAEISIP